MAAALWAEIISCARILLINFLISDVSQQIHLHFLSFLNTEETHAVETILNVRQGPVYHMHLIMIAYEFSLN